MNKNITRIISIVFLLLVLLVSIADAKLKTIDFRSLVGYVILDYTNVKADLDTDSFGRKVVLDNGMVFEFKQHPYTYFYNLDVVVLTKQISDNLTIYKLIIDDKIYVVNRLK